MATWERLTGELDCWRHAPRPATFWWRDDDAVEVTPELETVLEISEATNTPVALAVIPGARQQALGAFLATRRTAFVLQHGYMHRNHASPPSKKSEFGPGRTTECMLSELVAGRRRLAAFARALPVFVPPWNRYDRALLPVLPKAGFWGLSAYRARARDEARPGLKQNNAHVDIVDWRQRRFAGERAALGLAVEHLAARREGRADAGEATGLLTHHRVHDSDCWAFVRRFLDVTHRHPAARWMNPEPLFSP